MKSLRRFVSLFLVFAFFSFFVQAVYAKDDSPFNLPNDAVILYKDDNCVLYQSKELNSSSSRAPVDYESVWLDKAKIGSFKIHNSRSGRTGVTWKVESEAPNSYATIYMMNPLGLIVLNSKTIRPSDGDVALQLVNGVKGDYTVHYQGFPSLNKGMRIMCWMYDA